MGKRVGRIPVEVNISSPQNNHIPLFDESTRLWNTLSTSSLFAELFTGSNKFSGSQTIEGDLTVSGSIFAYNVSASSLTGSLFGTASLSRNSISASYLSGSQGIVNTFTSSGDIRIRNITISTGFSPGLNNIVVGSGSLLAISNNLLFAGDENIAIGNRVLSATTLGSSNTAVGFAALQRATSSFNTAIGAYALWSTVSGRNTAVGQGSLPYLVSGSGNTAVGDASMFFLVSGSNNTAIGNVGMQSMVFGSGNTSLGSGVLFSTFLSGSNNTVLGFLSALGIVTGSANTIIGANVTGLPTTLNNNIILADGEGNIRARYSSSIWNLSDSTVGNFTGSLLGTASWAENSVTASFAPDYLPLTGGTINGDVVVNGTASISFLNVTYESASVIYSSGSNQFGDASDDVQTLYGSVVIPTGSLSITGSISSTEGISGSLYGTASWALTASYAANVPETASYALQAISSSYPIAVSGSTIYTPFEVSNFSTNNSIFLGYSAGTDATTAFNSNFLGNQAGYKAEGGYHSNFIGQYAGAFAYNANHSNFIGLSSGYSASNAYYSNFIGNQAGEEATNAYFSNFIGNTAGQFANNAYRSNFIGSSTGYQAVNANYSNFIGDSAGFYATSASYSTLIGYRVGYGFSISGVNSIGSNNIIIGTNITLNKDRRDSINLGGVIFGTGSYSTSTGVPFSGSTNGRIGINQPFPLFSLDVSGSGRYENGLTVTGSLVAPNITGSLQGTASWALNALTASYAANVPETASYALQALNTVSASFATSASQAQNAVTASYILNAVSASYALSSSFAVSSSRAVSASAATTAVSSSYPIAVNGTTIYSVTNVGNFSTTDSILVGREAGSGSSNSDNSILLGYRSGWRTTNSSNLISIGQFAGANVSNVANSVFIGVSSGQAISASNAVFIGAGAGNGSFASSGSVFIGQSAGNSSNYSNGSVCIGRSAGFQITNANNSILIGENVGANTIGNLIGSNNIIIGTNITVNTGRKNAINIGGILFGTGSYSTVSNTAFSGSANGRIGINQPFPLFSLDVSGSGRYTNDLIITGSLISPNITGSLFGTASWALNSVNALTASYVEAGSIQNLATFQIFTGSIFAKVNTTIESLFLINSGSSTYFNISSSGNTELYSDLFIVKSITTNQPVFTVSQSIVKFSTQSLDPVGTAEAGALWFTSTNMYVALD